MCVTCRSVVFVTTTIGQYAECYDERPRRCALPHHALLVSPRQSHAALPLRIFSLSFVFLSLNNFCYKSYMC
jgi:hypothetical protein